MGIGIERLKTEAATASARDNDRRVDAIGRGAVTGRPAGDVFADERARHLR